MVAGGCANTYDFENRMLAHGAVTLLYDGDGNRVSETIGGTTTKFLVDDHNPTGLQQVLDEIVSGSVTKANSSTARGRPASTVTMDTGVSGSWRTRLRGTR